MQLLRKKKDYFLKALLCVVLFCVLGYGLLLFISYRAADIFNIVVENRQMFPGRVTVERLSASPWGEVSFEGLKWQTEEGTLLADIPKGSFKVKPWDVVTQRIGTQSITELKMERAYLHLILDENMEMSDIYRKDSEEAKREKKGRKDKEGHVLTGLDSDRPFKCYVEFRNSTIEAESPGSKKDGPRRHFTIGHADLRLNINTRGKTQINLAAGHFTGTVEAEAINISGVLDFAPQVPTYDLYLGIRNCSPTSLDVGMKLDDPASITSHVSGELPLPIITGKVSFEKLHIPGLEFKDVQGDFHYENGLFTAQDVKAEAFKGNVLANGFFNIDEKAWGMDLHAGGLHGGVAAHDSNLRCLVTLDMHMDESRTKKTKNIYGKFYSGNGSYYYFPFNSLSGTFEQHDRKRLAFSDVNISLPAGDVTNASFDIIDGKAQIGPIYLNTDRNRIMVYKGTN